MTFEESAEEYFNYSYTSGYYRISLQEIWSYILEWKQGRKIDEDILDIVTTEKFVIDHEELVFDYCECLLLETQIKENIDKLLNGFSNLFESAIRVFTTYENIQLFENYMRDIYRKFPSVFIDAATQEINGDFLGNEWGEHCEALDLIENIVPDIKNYLDEFQKDYFTAWEFRRKDVTWYLNNKKELDSFLYKIISKNFIDQTINSKDSFVVECEDKDPNVYLWYDVELEDIIHLLLIEAALKNKTLIDLVMIYDYEATLFKNNGIMFYNHIVTILLMGIDKNTIIDNLPAEEYGSYMEYSLGLLENKIDAMYSSIMTF